MGVQARGEARGGRFLCARGVGKWVVKRGRVDADNMGLRRLKWYHSIGCFVMNTMTRCGEDINHIKAAKITPKVDPAMAKFENAHSHTNHGRQQDDASSATLGAPTMITTVIVSGFSSNTIMLTYLHLHLV